MEEEASARRQ